MIPSEAIRQLSEDIARCYEPERIVLFGSYAYGTPDSDSDVDMLVILPFEGKEARKAAEILTRVNPRFAVDLLARTPEQIRQRLAGNDFFLLEIMEKGTLLYAAPDRWMG